MYQKGTILLFAIGFLLMACNNAAKNSVEKADSINDANRDSALTRAGIITDERSSDFLVRASNAGMAQMEITSFAQQNSTIQKIREFAGMLKTEHNNLYVKLTELAKIRKLALPARVTDEKQRMITELRNKRGKNFDKDFILEMIVSHEQSINLFENAVTNSKDIEIKTFANDALPKLIIHLDSAKSLRRMYW